MKSREVTCLLPFVFLHGARTEPSACAGHAAVEEEAEPLPPVAADLAPVEALHLRLHKVAGLHPLGAQTCLQGVLRLDLKRRQPIKLPEAVVVIVVVPHR